MNKDIFTPDNLGHRYNIMLRNGNGEIIIIGPFVGDGTVYFKWLCNKQNLMQHMTEKELAIYLNNHKYFSMYDFSLGEKD